MSNYAQIIDPVSARIGKVPYILGVGVEIKNVVIVDGCFEFSARVVSETGERQWLRLSTCDDLPVLTDRGRAHRSKHYALKRGRPQTDNSETVAFRVSKEQHAWLHAESADRDISTSEFVRTLLKEKGMPE